MMQKPNSDEARLNEYFRQLSLNSIMIWKHY